MTVKWLNLTTNPPRIPVFYTLTKIHKLTLVGRPIISGCDGPTERLSSFVDKLLQPIAQIQDSYLKDTTHFIRFIESTMVPRNAFLVSMDVTSLCTNIPQEEGITIVCNAYENFHANNPPIATKVLREMLSLILKENSFQFNGKDFSRLPITRTLANSNLALTRTNFPFLSGHFLYNFTLDNSNLFQFPLKVRVIGSRLYLLTHGTAMGTKMAVAFANIFMASIEKEILRQSVTTKPITWKRFIDDVFCLWDTIQTKKK